MWSNEIDMMKISNKMFLRTILVLGATSILGACAGDSGSSHSDSQISDPFEASNRMVFAFNKGVDDVVVNPIIKVYRAVAPSPARAGIKNVLRNLKSPVRFGNQLLQGDLGGAGNEFVRTSINSLLGIGGIFDLAGYEGLEYEQEDFGQTLGVWGIGHGPYVVVPFIGPSSFRDYIGYAVDSFADPLRWYLHNIDEEGWYYAKLGADYLVLRDDLMDILEDLDASSIDYYAATRSTYYQSRAALVNDEAGSVAAAPQIPDFDD